MNWASVCAGSVGAAAIYLIKDDMELSVFIQRVLGSMESFLQGFDKDGLTTEGLGYWSYGFGFYVYFSELLKERTGGIISLLNYNEKVRKIAELPLYLQFPSEYFVSFSDVGGSKWSGDYGLLSRLEKTLGIREYNYPLKCTISNDATYRWAMIIRQLFWGADIEYTRKNYVKIGMRHFEESQWLVDRRIIDNKGFITFAAKGGNNGEPHNHNDLGNFILHYEGSNIFIDMGAAEYTKQYFNEETQYNFLATSSLGHSVPVINNCVEIHGESHYARVINCEEKDFQVHYKLDLKEAYSCSELTKYSREFLWNYNKMELFLNDYFEFKPGDNRVEEVFITQSEPKFVEPGKVIIEVNNCIAELYFEKELHCSIKEEGYSNHSAKEAYIFRICLLKENISLNEELNFRIVIVPKILRKALRC